MGKQLAAAASDADRDQLLAAHPELPYLDVRPPFMREIVRLFQEGRYPEVDTLCHYLDATSKRFNDPRGVVLAHLFLANVSNQRGDYDEAAAGYAQTLELATSANHAMGKLSAASGIGILEQRRGDYVAALEHQQLALQYATEMKNPEQIADCLLNLGSVSSDLGDTRQSLDYYRRAQELKGADPAYAPYLLNGLGVVYQSQGDAAAALSYFQRASQASESQHFEREAISAGNNIGEARRALGQYAESVAAFQEVLSRAERLGTKKGIGLAWVNLGLTYNAQGRSAAAWDACREGLAKLEAIGDRPGMSDALTCESEAALAKKDIPAAQEAAERSVKIAEEINDVVRQWKPLTLSGRAHQATREWKQATIAYDRAITAIETMRDRVVGDERQRQRFFQDKSDPYYAMVDVLVQQGQPEKAFGYAERARARVLQDVFGGGSQAAPSRLMTSDERSQETQLNRVLANWSRQLYQETIGEKPSAPRIAMLKRRLESARIDAEGFRTALFLNHPELKVLRGDSTTVTRQELEPLLAQGHRALLEFVVLDRNAYLFVSTQGRFRVYPLAVSRRDLEADVEQLRTSIANRGQAFRPIASKLFRQLLQPAAEQLRGVTALCIVPDGELWELPYQALIQPTGKYVIEDYAVSYAPSLTVLRDMRRHPRSAPTAGTSIALLAVGNPEIAGARKANGPGMVSRSAPSALPDAETEVRQIGELFRSSRTEILTGDQANEDRFKRTAGQARILHLATHGILNNANPLYSSLLLATSSKTSSQEDGLLEAWEIMQMNLHSELAVLSACETGRGRVRPGEGMIGLSWAFFVAGVPRTVVSQWKVESSSTAELMIDFYRRYLQGDPPARALQGAAKRLLLEKGQFRHPFFWAPFIVVGNID